MNSILLFLLILIRIQISLISAAVIELTDNNYEEFIHSNRVHLISLCSNKLEKCRQLNLKFKELSLKVSSQLGIDLPIGIIDIEKYQKISNKYINEGFPTIFFVENNIPEVYIGSKDPNKLLKYLKYKLKVELHTREVSTEKEILESLNITDEYVLIFLGSPKNAPFHLDTLSQAAHAANIFKVFMLNNTVNSSFNLNNDEYDLAILKQNTSNNTNIIRRLGLSDEDDLSLNKLKQIILINKQNMNGFIRNLDKEDLDLTLSEGIPTLFYIYGGKKQLITDDIVDLANRYTNEFLFVKSSVNNKWLKKLEFVKFFNITKDDLPVLVLTANNPFSTDDVEKYIVKASQLFAHLKRGTENNLEINKAITKQTVENFIENYKKGKLYKSYFTENLEMKITGENFIQIVDEALQEGNEIVLLICPSFSKKYKRIRARLERAFDKIYKINENKILFDEIDPFTNELSFIDYQYIPTIALIQKNSDQFSLNKWTVTTMNNGFTNEEIIDFVRTHTQIENFKLNITDIDATLTREERKRPLFPINKQRLEGKFLSDNLITYDIGFKRKWYNLKKNGIVSNESKNRMTLNEYEEDYEDNFDVNDDTDENSYYKREDL